MAVLTLAVGIGATSAAFTMANAVLWKPLPVRDAEQVRLFAWSAPTLRTPSSTFSADEYRRLRDSVSGIDVACGWNQWNAMAEWGPVGYELVTGNYFRVLGVQALRGRMLGAADDGAAVAVISANLWRRAYGRDEGILARTITLNRATFQIVGVMAEGFAGLDPAAPRDVMVPRGIGSAIRGTTPDANSRVPCREVVARLAPGTPDERVRLEGLRVLRELRLAGGSPTADSVKLLVTPVESSSQSSTLQARTSRELLLLLGATAALLLATCLNLAALLLARGRDRVREIAVRLSLGAGRGRIVRQLVAESLVIAIVGGAVGLFLAYAATPWLPDAIGELGARDWLNPAITPGVDLIVDGRAIAFSAVVTFVTVLAFGVWPAIRTSAVDIVSAIKPRVGGGYSPRGAAVHSLLSIQVAVSVLLLIGAGLLVRSVQNLATIPVGYKADGLVFVSVDPRGQPASFIQDTTRELKRAAGVSSVGVSQWPLYNNAEPKFPVCVPGYLAAELPMDVEPVSADFFDAWGVPLIQGRDFAETDSMAAPSSAAPGVRFFDDGASASRGLRVAIVNATFARRVFGSASPIGKQIGIGRCPGDPKVIIGVVGDHIDRPRVPVTPMVYVPYPASAFTLSVTFAVRVPATTPSVIAAVRHIMADAHAQVDGDVIAGAAYKQREWRRERLLAAVLVIFALFTVSVAAIGVYGIVDINARSRTAELAVRTALGATRSDLVRLVMTSSFVAVGIGAIAGIYLAGAAARLVDALLFNVVRYDPLTISVATGVIAVTAAIAAFFPAARTARMDPMIALRAE